MLWFHCGHVFFEWYSWWNQQYWSIPMLSTFSTTLNVYADLDGWLLLLPELISLLMRSNIGGLLLTVFSLDLCFSSTNSLDKDLMVCVKLSISFVLYIWNYLRTLETFYLCLCSPLMIHHPWWLQLWTSPSQLQYILRNFM